MVPTNLADHLRHRADRYFEDVRGEQVHVALRRVSRRTNSTLHEFVVGAGNAEHVILVKQPAIPRFSRRNAAAGEDRPRLYPKSCPELKSRFEFRAMSAIERYVTRLNDPRFGAVRVLELLPDGQSLVMEKVSEQSLSRLLFNGTVVPRSRALGQRLEEIVRNSGSWLRRYHSLPELEHTQSRGESRTVFLESVERFTGYLARATGRASFEKLGRELTEAALAILPPRLPLGLAHGDYAPRNVLAGPTGQIRVIDTQARWRAPVYEDISLFLTAVKASSPQVFSRGFICRPRIAARLEQQFLAGYFEEEEIPLSQIRLFECQTIVERWAGLAFRSQEARGWKRLVKGGRAVWANGYLQKLVRQLLTDVNGQPPESNLSLGALAR